MVLLVSACGGGEKPAPSPSTSSPSTLAGVPGLVHPDADQRAAFLRDLRVISPGLAENEDRAVRRGRNACLDLAESRKLAVSHVVKAESVNARVAGQVVTAAQRHFCPSNT